MDIKCPKCQTGNPSDSKFCKECATSLPLQSDLSATKTLEILTKGLATGSTFAGRYRIIEELGKGGMGSVYKALDMQINEEVAIKLIRPEIASDEKTLERFSNELKLARKIGHKNVCRMFHLEKEEEVPYISMEFLEGEDLKSIILKKEKLSAEDAIGIAQQICEGLVEAHRLGVVHRDLKPQNIMIDQAGHAKIMDFGIARSVEAPGMTQTGVIIGTPDYISPEQSEGKEADERSDIYSLGVILYEMVTGRVPFSGNSALSVAIKHKTQLPSDPRKLNPEVSDNLARLILICMEKERERRYQTAKDLLTDLINIEEGFPLGTKIRPRRHTFFASLIQNKLFIPVSIIILALIAVIIWQLLPDNGVIPIPSDKPSLAILDFENYSGDESLNNWQIGFRELFFSDMSQSKYIRVLRGDQIISILKRLDLFETKEFTVENLIDIAKQGQVNHILKGGLLKTGDSLRITATLISGVTGETIESITKEAREEETYNAAVDEFVSEFKPYFNLTQDQIYDDIDREVGDITTSSPEAYRFYSQGREYFHNGDYSLCIPFMKRAIDIDPDFATAYYILALSSGYLGYGSEQMKNFQKALELSERLPERERYVIQGATAKTIDKRIEVYTKLLELYPDDLYGNNELGRIYINLEEWEKAIERFDVLIQNNEESYFPYVNKAISLMSLGLYDKAGEILESYLKTHPNNTVTRWYLAINYLCQNEYELALNEVGKNMAVDPTIWFNLSLKGDIHLCMGDSDQAEKEYRKLIESEAIGSQGTGRRRLHELYTVLGKINEAENLVKEGLEIAKKYGSKNEEISFYWWLAHMYINDIKSGDLGLALDELEKAWDIAVETESLGYQITTLHWKGLAYIKMRNIAEAQRTAEELKMIIENSMNKKRIRSYYHLMGRVELERENFPEAIELLQKSIGLLSAQAESIGVSHALFMDSLANAYFRAKDLNKAREEYEKIISLTTGRLGWGEIYVRSFYMLGKVCEKQGDQAKAIEYYEIFLDLRKDADPGIAEVEDAKKRLAGLRRN